MRDEARRVLNGESESPEHLARNPFGYVPALEIDEGAGKKWMLTESLAVLEWLEETHPHAPLYPGDAQSTPQQGVPLPLRNHQCRHPAGSEHRGAGSPERAVLGRRRRPEGLGQNFIKAGLNAYQALCRPWMGRFSVGDELSAADLCLIPQIYNARRFAVDLGPFPELLRIEEAALALPASLAAHPDRFAP